MLRASHENKIFEMQPLPFTKVESTIPERFFVLILFLDFIPKQKDLNSWNTPYFRNNIPRTKFFLRNTIPEQRLDEMSGMANQ